METIYTVLITLGVVAFIATVWGVIRLSRRVADLELVRMELVDLEGQFKQQLENEIQDRESLQEDIHKRFDEWIASTDRRTDKLWAEWHNLNDRVKTLNKTINPNLELLKQ
jgi:predicted  nucleic acid-binding Zn-ribbon protein